MMSEHGAQDIVFRSAIAACNNGPNLRVYMQDVLGKIRETVYDGEWGNGTEKNVIATAKLGTPIACASKDLKMIRVYYMSPDNMIREAAFDHSKGWSEGIIAKDRLAVAPYSKLAACCLEGQGLTMRLYCQMPDNTIQEFGLNEGEHGWKKMQNLGPAMPGSEITCTTFKMSDMNIRVYFQEEKGNVVEKCFKKDKGWFGGALKIPDLLPRTAMACTSFMMGNQVGIRLFYATSNRLLEMAWDGKKWFDGNFHVECIPGTEIACVSWGSGNHLNIRVYFQKGEMVSGISEWMWLQGNWKAGKLTIPPT